MRAAAAVLCVLSLAGCAGWQAQNDSPAARETLRNSLPVAAAALAAGQTDVARRLYLALAERFDRAPEPFLGLGYIAFRSRDLPAAETYFEQAAERATETPAVRVEALLGAGRTALARSRPRAARRYFESARESARDTPSEPWIANGLAVAATLEADWEAAAAHYAEALRRSSRNPRVAANFVRMLIAAGRVDEAARIYAEQPAASWPDDDATSLLRLIGEASRERRARAHESPPAASASAGASPAARPPAADPSPGASPAEAGASPAEAGAAPERTGRDAEPPPAASAAPPRPEQEHPDGSPAHRLFEPGLALRLYVPGPSPSGPDVLLAPSGFMRLRDLPPVPHPPAAVENVATRSGPSDPPAEGTLPPPASPADRASPGPAPVASPPGPEAAGAVSAGPRPEPRTPGAAPSGSPPESLALDAAPSEPPPESLALDAAPSEPPPESLALDAAPSEPPPESLALDAAPATPPPGFPALDAAPATPPPEFPALGAAPSEYPALGAAPSEYPALDAAPAAMHARPPSWDAPGDTRPLPLPDPEAPVAAPLDPLAPRTLTVALGQSRRVHLDSDATSVLVAAPEVADVQLLAPNVLYVIGKGIGRTSVAVLDADEWIEERIVSVVLDLAPLQAILAGEPDLRGVRARRLSRGMALTGEVTSAAAADRARRLAAGALPEGVPIENEMQVATPQQVTLEVQIVEVNRSVTESLGVDWESFGTHDSEAFGFRVGQALGPTDDTLGLDAFPPRVTEEGQWSSIFFGSKGPLGEFRLMVDALATAGLANVLARPTLTAVSGESASFLSGGEYPFATGVGENDRPLIDTKEVGVVLNFIPTVVDAERIVLTVRPEVSELSRTEAVPIGGVSYPVFNVRRAETTVEVGDGESIVIAGLFRNRSSTNESGVPVLKDAPVLGALFGTTSTDSSEQELIVVVTARLVRARTAPEETEAPPATLQASGYHY